MLRLQREVAAAKAERLGVKPFEALLDRYEPGGSMAMIDRLFGELTAFLPDLIEAVLDAPGRDAALKRSTRTVSDSGTAAGGSAADGGGRL